MPNIRWIKAVIREIDRVCREGYIPFLPRHELLKQLNSLFPRDGTEKISPEALKRYFMVDTKYWCEPRDSVGVVMRLWLKKHREINNGTEYNFSDSGAGGSHTNGGQDP